MIFFCSLGFFLLLLFGYSMTASNRRCLPLEEGGLFCFTQPDPPMALSWSSAMQWCKSIGATLPILNSSYHNSVYQNALGYFRSANEDPVAGSQLHLRSQQLVLDKWIKIHR